MTIFHAGFSERFTKAEFEVDETVLAAAQAKLKDPEVSGGVMIALSRKSLLSADGSKGVIGVYSSGLTGPCIVLVQEEAVVSLATSCPASKAPFQTMAHKAIVTVRKGKPLMKTGEPVPVRPSASAMAAAA